MVPPASLRVSRVRRYSGYCRPTCHFVYGTLTLFGLPSQVILLCLVVPYSVLNPGCIATSGLPSFLFARRYSENLFWFLFLALLRCFSSGGFPAYTYLFSIRWPDSIPAGFPHSEICGSMAICAYPQLIAAYHVFRRLLMPRHSPCALSNLTSLFQVFPLELLRWIIWVSVIYSFSKLS